MTPLTNVLVSLRKEQARLERLLARVNRAIDALTDAPAKKKVATKKRRMSAASNKAVSDSMTPYWAAKKSAGRHIVQELRDHFLELHAETQQSGDPRIS